MSAQAANEPWTVLRLINWTREYFERQGLEAARLSAEMLLAHVLECPRLGLYTQFDRAPTAEQLARYRELVKQAAGGEPIAYLVGHREFYSLDFLVSREVLIPRAETEVLAERAIDFLRRRERPTCWDICTGSGAIAVAVAVNVPEARVLATDIIEPAVEVARRNIEKHKLGERVTVVPADLLTLPDAAGQWGPFDAVTANPPYVAEGQRGELSPQVLREPEQALFAGEDGLGVIRRILADAPGVLTAGGMLSMEIGFGQAGTVWDIVSSNDTYERAEFARDAAGIERVLIAYRRAK